ncbi:tumor necrosis factor receptor superfamily, member 21 (predicted) [Rattus norvegicus]|uniref:Tumor necrosis factor receptor superfamily member 21 n=1 Tax=Rattus norvegicus TaxID=10116 RepID=TNR21_RAT|nr:tumor necrosis factor receptor superfamily member 21 precursor [Rattus norvegicus]D3ZF92.1 RecName: Full=Tumor necrosis factor receptor superfamily member 21; AltName: Full=Death receptor 6; AltName: CD_antigen=CD358; Flags: Precursor [Rattus norvegicus]EDM18686.1 tumor necrosis factor receptor superfamily, member 21 (predicted) [Rattus norvegicus]|eukprot:NP_001101677.1 tumor necrosis factor receptor superfamily member 21 precursor [Rattus norvegicus]
MGTSASSITALASCSRIAGQVGATMVAGSLLLLGFLSTITAQPEQKTLSLTGTYRHVDRTTGQVLTCDKCPAGTYVSEHCTNTSLRVCSSCPSGTFTRHENGIERCHDCSQPCPRPMIERLPCAALTDRECICPPGMYQSNGTCAPHTVCPVGWGVRKKGTENEDVRCKQCARGTFSDVPSSVMKCRAHTDCLGQNLMVVKQGTKETDNVCGVHLSSSSTTPSSPGIATFSHPEHTESHDVPSSTYEPQGMNSTDSNSTASVRTKVPSDIQEETVPDNTSSTSGKESTNRTLPNPPQLTHQQGPHHRHILKLLPSSMEATGEKSSTAIKAPKRGHPRQNPHKHFDINEHLPWMIVLFLLLVLVLIVVCSIRKSSRTLKKGPRQDPSAIMEKAGLKKSLTPTQNREKWIYYRNGHGIDILKLVAAQVGSQWKDIYQFLCNASEREVAAFSNGYTADHERAYAALQHWTIRGPEASLAQLISALRQHRRNDVVEKIRGLMEDTTQLETDKLALPMSPSPLSPSPIPSPNVKLENSTLLTVEPSPLDKNKGFFVDESEPLLRCDSTSSGSSALSRNGSFITKEKKDTVLRQVRLDPCDLQPIFDDMLHILNPEELRVIEEIPQAEDKLDRLFEIIGVKSQEASQTLLDSVYSHLPDLL